MTRVGVLTRALACGLVALLAGSCTAAQPAADDEKPTRTRPTASRTLSPPPPPPPAPKTGECRVLHFDDISRFSNDTETRTCSRRHTSYTFAVEQLPSDIAFDGVTIDNDAVQRTAADSCQSQFVDFIGGTTASRSLARLSVTYFVPDQRGFDLGARWVRCDVIGLQTDTKLAPLPQRLQGFLDDDDSLDEYGVCSKGAPGSAEFKLVMCRANHDYRAIEAVRLGTEDASYPGLGVVRDDGRARCEDIVADLLGIGGGYTFGWTYPSAEDWSTGQRFGYCWLQSSD